MDKGEIFMEFNYNARMIIWLLLRRRWWTFVKAQIGLLLLKVRLSRYGLHTKAFKLDKIAIILLDNSNTSLIFNS